jgi:hypothetical protein
MMTINDERVKAAYVAWADTRTVLAEAERRLATALEIHARGGSLPLTIIGEVNELRAETDRLFTAAIEAVRTRGNQPGSKA